ncbi:MAG: hypothetical protein VKK04_27210 [Synechococcales bacterium]|nr:hypothetical protein [Synechococcales bacterium]
MSLSVGPIQRYVPGSTWFDLTKYSNLGTQERVSINLVESDLWLIDSSDLYLPYDYAPRVAFINEGAGYQSPVSMTAMGSTTGEATVFSNLSGINSILPSRNAPLRVGDWVQISEVKANTQLNFSVTPNGVSNPRATPLSTDSSLNPISASNPNSPIFWTAYADPKATKPLLLLAYEDIAGPGSDNDFNDGVLAIDVGQENFNAIFSRANLGQDASANLVDLTEAQAAPFEIHSAVGLLVVGAIALARRAGWWRQSQPANLS